MKLWDENPPGTTQADILLKLLPKSNLTNYCSFIVFDGACQLPHVPGWTYGFGTMSSPLFFRLSCLGTSLNITSSFIYLLLIIEFVISN